MYFGRVRETTTTTGTGTVTLAGAVTQYQAFQTQNQVGDSGIDYTLLDGNGTAWEYGTGTLVTSSTFSRDVIDDSSNSGSAINLSSNTHKIFLSYNATSTNKRWVEGDSMIDYVVSGLSLPTTSANLTGTLSSGQAYVVGQRVVKGAQAHTYTASKDTYVDLDNLGVLHYSAVGNGAGAPSLTSNSIRLGFVTTGASAITSATTTGKDSLGNVMRNTIYTPTCKLVIPSGGGQVIGNTPAAITFGSGTTTLDNDGMHSESSNTSRITINHAGLYHATAFCAENGAISYIYIYKNGSVFPEATVGSGVTAGGQTIGLLTSVDALLAATDYIEAFAYNSSSQTVTAAGFSAVRVG